MAGGIAAYKAVEVLRGLREAGHDVTVAPTAAALHFVGETTWAALSGRPVAASVWDGADEVRHVRLGQEADLVLVVPATADLIARSTHGIANDLLTNVLLTARCPIMLAPAMHTEMWQHPATRRNVAELRDRGIVVLEPAEGRLTARVSLGLSRTRDAAGEETDACQRDLTVGAGFDSHRPASGGGPTRRPSSPRPATCCAGHRATTCAAWRYS